MRRYSRVAPRQCRARAHGQPARLQNRGTIGSGSGSGCRTLSTAPGAPSVATEGGEPATGVSALGRVALALPGLLTFGLGTWQVSRLQWKYEQIELRAALLARPPRLVSRAAHVGGDSARQFAPEEDGTEFERVRLVGRFDHAGEVCVGMRGKPGAKEEERGAGYSVVTPLDIGDGEDTARVYVNRGWVPQENLLPNSRAEGQHVGEVRVEAVVRKGEHGAWYMPKTSGSKDRTMTWIDLLTVAQIGGKPASDGQLLLFDAVLADAPDAALPSSQARGHQHPMTPVAKAPKSPIVAPEPRPLGSYGEFPVTPWKHQVYAATWFGLSFCIGLMYVSRVSRLGRFIGRVTK